MSEKNVDSLFEDILDTNLDDIKDLPEYLDYAPTGSYVLEIVEAEKTSVEVDKEGGGKMDAPVIRVTYEVVSVQEFKNAEDAHLVKTRETDGAGSRFSESFFFHKDKKKSSEIFKAKYLEIAKKFGFTDLSSLLEGMKSLTITATVKSTKSKNDAERFFINTKNIQVV